MAHRGGLLSSFILVVVAVVVCFAVPARAEKRIALIVGNSSYRNIPHLDNPVNDAKLMADTLRGLGFTLIGGGAQLDLEKAGLDNAVQSFGQQIQGADVALFYYAGHGVQVSGTNYLVPVGANPIREADVDFQMVDVNLVLRQMLGSGAKLNLVILDACRNNPFGGRGLRGSEGGLAQMRAPEGTLISYATQPGNVAQDGADGNSPYTKSLAQTIQRSGLDIFQTFNEVGLAVKRLTGGSQQPWVSSSPIDGNFYFTAPSVATTPPAHAGPVADEITWSILTTTIDIAALRQFVVQFPASAHRAAAETRIATLEQDALARVQATEELRKRSQAEAQRGQQVTVLAPGVPPASLPSALSDTQADGLFTQQDMRRVNAIATKDKLLVLPQFKIERPDNNLPVALRKFIGIWASEIGFNGGIGRHGMLIVTDVDTQGRASGYFVWGSPTAFGPQFPAGYTQFAGKIADDQLTFNAQGYQGQGYAATIRFTGNDHLLLAQKRSDGTIVTVTINPMWRLVEAEHSAKR